MEAGHVPGVDSGVSLRATRALQRQGQAHMVIPDLRKVLQKQKNSVPEGPQGEKWRSKVPLGLGNLPSRGFCNHAPGVPASIQIIAPEPRLAKLRSSPVPGIRTRAMTPHRHRPGSRTHPTAPMNPKDLCRSSTQRTPHALSTHSTGSRHVANLAQSSSVPPGILWPPVV